MGELGVIHKFTKWVILRIELKFNDIKQSIQESDLPDRNLQLRLLQDAHEKNIASIALRSSVVSLIVLGITLVSAVLSVLGFL